MAYTITATPPVYSSLQDDLIYTVSYVDHTSDPVTYPNFKFIGDVYVGATHVARIKKVPDPETGIGIFNIGQIVRNYLNNIFDPTPNVIIAQSMGNSVFSLEVTMVFGEEYGFTEFLNLVPDSARTFFNYYSDRRAAGAQRISAVVNGIASARPRTVQVRYSDTFSFLPYFAFSGGTPVFMISPFGGGTGYSGNLAPTILNMAILNLSPQAINAVHPGTITPATNYYIININGQLIRYELICEAIFTVYNVHFLNRYGGWETKSFTKVSRPTVDITRKDFGKLNYTVNGAGQVSYKNTNNVYNETRSVYAVTYKESLELNTDLLTDADYVWLQDLVLSPMVYLEDSGNFFPVSVTAKDYEQKKFVNDELTNLTITVEFGQVLNSQFR